jgi:2-(1,2-epoxy-1,2-dihydrophenyl)acetyl-CoA isomerase
MTAPAVLSAVEDGVMTLTLNRPDVLNALSPAMLTGLSDALATAKADDAIRAVVLTGAGRGFCAGADLGSDAMRTGRVDVSRMIREQYNPVILTMRQCPKPIVGAVNGSAAGGGMSLALACDVVIAAESATFLQAFSRIGLIPDCGSTWFLPRLVGDVRARAMMLMGEKIPAADALRYGLVWKVVADDALADEARRIAAHLAQMPTRALDLTKQALIQGDRNGLGEQLEVEALMQGQAFRTEDFREGVAAFVEKRAPRFVGR